MFVLQIVTLYFLFHFTSSYNFETILIKDYVERHGVKSVTAYLCWNFDRIKSISDTLFRQNITVNFKKSVDSSDDFGGIKKIPNSLLILDFSCQRSENILYKANEDNLFERPHHWIILLPTNNEKIENILRNLDVLIDSRVVLAQKLNVQEYSFNYVYKIHKKSDILFNRLAYWNSSKGFLYFNNKPITWARHNLKGHLLKAAFVIQNQDSFKHMDDYRYNEVDSYTKLSYFLTHALLDYLNATRKFIYVSTWDVYDSNKSYGLLGVLQNKLIDISGSPIFCRKDRLVWFDCLVMTTPGKTFFIFRQPPLSYVKNIYTLPFETKLWIVDIAFLFISSAFLYLIILWEWKILNAKNEEPEIDMIDSNFSDAFMFTVGAVCQQGYPREPKRGSGKITIMTIFLTLIFIFTAYSAYTVVLFQSTADDIKTLDDLYNSQMALGVENKTYYLLLFPTYTEKTRRKIYTERIAPKGGVGNFYNLKEGMEKVRKENFAFYIDSVSGYKVIQDLFLDNEKCGLQQIHYLYESDPWIATPKNSSFMKIFKIGYLRIQEFGLNVREIRKRVTHKPECLTQGSSFRSAGILDLYSVYMLLIIGISLSIVILIAEIIYKNILAPRLEKETK